MKLEFQEREKSHSKKTNFLNNENKEAFLALVNGGFFYQNSIY